MAEDDIAADEALLSNPNEEAFPTLDRAASSYSPLTSFHLSKGDQKHYQQQFADMYFARLAQLKPAAEAIASKAWADFQIAGEHARRVERVLEVRQGELSWIVGTVFMEMALKPNVLEDLGKEHWIAAPPPRIKYVSPNGGDQVTLEDESGRLELVGPLLKKKNCILVTGAVVAVLGTENANGQFEVVDIKVPDLPRQPQRWERDDGEAAVEGKKAVKGRQPAGKVAIVSGLSISSEQGDTLALDLLTEFLLGESTTPDEQEDTATISRLIIAGNSVHNGSPIPSREDIVAANTKKASRKYGYDSSAYNAAPTERLDVFLSAILPSIPVTLLPGATDPTTTALPQQPIHMAMFPHSKTYMELPTSDKVGWFDSVTNPTEFDLDGWRFLGTGGQTVDDVYKYVASNDRLMMMETMLRWRLVAPTAPDTLWCFPFQDEDRFVLRECPHVYFVGNQPNFGTEIIEGPVGQTVRLVAVPEFSKTRQVVVMDLETLECETVRLALFDG